MLGSAVCQHEPRRCSRSDGRQVPLAYLCGLKVSHPAGIHSLYGLLFSHNASLQYILSSSVCVCCVSEQVLHLWLEVLCSSMNAVEKWYHPWSFLRSPGWVQIKCELR